MFIIVPCSRISRYLINSGNSHLDSLSEGAELLLIQQLTSLQAWGVTIIISPYTVPAVIDRLNNDEMKQMIKEPIPKNTHSISIDVSDFPHASFLTFLSFLLYFFLSSLKMIY